MAAGNEDGDCAAQLIDLQGYIINEAGKLELKPGSHQRRVEDARMKEDMVLPW
jgi:hypothetical protein